MRKRWDEVLLNNAAVLQGYSRVLFTLTKG